MTSSRGNPVPNQFIIEDVVITYHSRTGEILTPPSGDMFQSYNTCIAFKSWGGSVFLDSNAWDYSVTTSKYRNQFLGETKAETQKKIDSGEYILTNLNGWLMKTIQLQHTSFDGKDINLLLSGDVIQLGKHRYRINKADATRLLMFCEEVIKRKPVGDPTYLADVYYDHEGNRVSYNKPELGFE